MFDMNNMTRLLKKGGGNFMYQEIKRNNKNNQGFTLIELVIIITILAVLAVVGFQTIGTGAIAKSKAQADITNAQTLAKCIESAIQEDRLVLTGAAGSTVSLIIRDDTTAAGTTSRVGAVLTGYRTESSQPNLNPAKVYIQKIPTLSRINGYFWLRYTYGVGRIEIFTGTATEIGTTKLYPRQDSYANDPNYNVLEQ